MNHQTTNLPKNNDLDSKDDCLEANEETFPIKLYKRRWLMLALFVLSSITSTAQFLEYSIISNIISRYYDVSRLSVACTALVFSISYSVLIVPVLMASDKLSLKTMILLGCIASCAGSWIKIFSLSPNRFDVLIIGQSVAALAQPFRLPLPGRVAAKWFGSNEQSTATAIGILGIHLGVLTSYVLPTTVVHNHDDLNKLRKDLTFLAWIVITGSTISLLSVIFLFQDEPKLPPSRTRALQKTRRQVNKSLLAPIGRLLTNKQFLLLCGSFGCFAGFLDALSTLLNDFYMAHFKDSESEVGTIGLILQISGVVGLLFCGVFLDITHKFKATAVTFSILFLCGQMIFSACLMFESKVAIRVATAFLGFAVFSYISSAYQNSIEFTYPEDENLAAGLLNVFYHVFGALLILILNETMKYFREFTTHAIMSGVLFLGLVITIFTKDVQRRQDASIRQKNDPQYHPFNPDDVAEGK